MKNIESIEELRKVKEFGEIQINGNLEVVTGIFSKYLMTYTDIQERIDVKEYDLNKNQIESQIIISINEKENAREYFLLKDLISLYKE